MALFLAPWFGRPLVAQTESRDYFKIQVIDEATGRGVPLVELRTTHEVRYYTDSNGIVAFFEPGLMDQTVYFHVRSHGYEYPKDGFGYRGKALQIAQGGSAVLKLKRIQIAERLYRVTGQGIYRDSELVGQAVPLKQPQLSGQVTGQDSVLATPYRGRLFWIWGDTNRPSYPLGNFGVSGARSEWPAPRGTGLDPSRGIDLTYFTNQAGFSRPMIPAEAVSGPGPKWLGGMVVLRDASGTDRLIAKYVRMKDLGTTLERGLVVFNDRTESFERLVQFDLAAPLHLDGHPVPVNVGGTDYLYCGYGVPHNVRVRADIEHVKDPAQYEAFTCLVAGSRYEKGASKLDRGPDGRLRWSWKRDTTPLGFDQQNELINAGKLKRDEAWIQFTDVETGAAIKPHAGSVYWNAYRNRWITIFEQAFGTSNLGEVWYAESDTPTGPWVYARKVLTHDKYSFYNPTQHPFFDQAGGRTIYFQGTYSDLFSGSPEKTPRYDYNQIMYRLRLDDPRLFLPVPVYRVRGAEGGDRYLLREGVETAHAWQQVQETPFLACPPGRVYDGSVAVYVTTDERGPRLQLDAPDPQAHPLFFALPPRAASEAAPPASTVPLYQYTAGRRFYSTRSEHPNAERDREPICRVWRNPAPALPIEPARPANLVNP
jgi:hypothetical protein